MLQARRLRSIGFSLRSISNRLQISKSTASLWLRDSKLTVRQRKALLARPGSRLAKSSRELALERTAKWQREAKYFWEAHKSEPLFLLGIGLYWGEGGKTQKCLTISNNDPGLLGCWALWCRTYLPSDAGLYVRILAHADVDAQRARRFWAKATGYRVVKHVTRLPSRGNKKPKKLALYGTASVQLGKGSAEWCTKMLLWIVNVRTEYLFS